MRKVSKRTDTSPRGSASRLCHTKAAASTIGPAMSKRRAAKRKGLKSARPSSMKRKATPQMTLRRTSSERFVVAFCTARGFESLCLA